MRSRTLAVLVIGVVACASLATTYRHTTTLAEIRRLESAITAFERDVGRIPSSEEGLSALLAAPTGIQSWNGPYLRERRTPTDAWGNPFVYHQPSLYGNRGFDLYSPGIDGKDDQGSHDDITNWSGAPSQFYSVPFPWTELAIVTAISLLFLLAAIGGAWAVIRAVRRRRSAA